MPGTATHFCAGARAEDDDDDDDDDEDDDDDDDDDDDEDDNFFTIRGVHRATIPSCRQLSTTRPKRSSPAVKNCAP